LQHMAITAPYVHILDFKTVLGDSHTAASLAKSKS
jgi:hypothetical protein